MRHRVSGRQLGRTINERQALYRTQLRSLFTYGFINTTAAKAKSLVPLAEKLAVAATKADLNSRRLLFSYFQDSNLVNRIATAFSTIFAGQVQNFTKMQNVKFRQGDNALVVKLSFVKEVNTLAPKKEKVKKEDKKETKKDTKKEVKKKAPAKKVAAKKETK